MQQRQRISANEPLSRIKFRANERSGTRGQPPTGALPVRIQQTGASARRLSCSTVVIINIIISVKEERALFNCTEERARPCDAVLSEAHRCFTEELILPVLSPSPATQLKHLDTKETDISEYATSKVRCSPSIGY